MNAFSNARRSQPQAAQSPPQRNTSSPRPVRSCRSEANSRAGSPIPFESSTLGSPWTEISLGSPQSPTYHMHHTHNFLRSPPAPPTKSVSFSDKLDLAALPEYPKKPDFSEEPCEDPLLAEAAKAAVKLQINAPKSLSILKSSQKGQMESFATQAPGQKLATLM